MPGKYALVEEAARHCWSKNFMGERLLPCVKLSLKPNLSLP
jgi:hypothetical protein